MAKLKRVNILSFTIAGAWIAGVIGICITLVNFISLLYYSSQYGVHYDVLDAAKTALWDIGSYILVGIIVGLLGAISYNLLAKFRPIDVELE